MSVRVWCFECAHVFPEHVCVLMKAYIDSERQCVMEPIWCVLSHDGLSV